MDDELREARVGIIPIWAQRYLEDYFMYFVLPTWTLTIDGIACERKLYEDISLGGRRVELEFQDYRFVSHCCFTRVLDIDF